ncbi:hypothetical protein NVIE_000820 [Nitrososphaera viennensis EN76]|uniref:Uncharacterized protein n=1 Tax=Nitrososphaera viennensis EN76 TaxID=926571 RepID=A0A060HFW3_9ARCH|nr:hypothetical protein NVIE_000820 [Nitrososphaera viennensis EN76]
MAINGPSYPVFTSLDDDEAHYRKYVRMHSFLEKRGNEKSQADASAAVFGSYSSLFSGMMEM